jgi:hypothetical protein
VLQGSGEICSSPVTIFVRPDAGRLGADPAAKGPRRIRFALGIANIVAGQTEIVRLRLTPRGRRIVRESNRTTLRGTMEIQNPGGMFRTGVRIRIRR